MHNNDLKVAIVHDWLYGGGAERVVQALHELYPQAPIYTSYATKEWQQKLNNQVVTGYLNKWPFTKLRKFLPVLRMWWFRSLDLSDYDLIISSSGNGEAKHIRLNNEKWQMKNGKLNRQVHINYCHTPVHFYWRNYQQYLDKPGFGMFDPVARLGLKLLVKPLRKADYKAAQKVDYFIANSTHIQRDIKKFYGRESSVVFPPIDTARFLDSKNDKPQIKNDKYFVTVSRLVNYKRFDIIVDACTKLNLPLTVVGRGPALANLQKRAGPTISFDTNASDEDVANYMQSAQAFLFAAFEDFGVTPVEAMAAGTPVIAYKAGGALDYVIPGKTGEFFAQQTAESLASTLQSFNATKYNHDDIKKHANKFSTKKFQKNIHNVIQNILSK